MRAQGSNPPKQRALPFLSVQTSHHAGYSTQPMASHTHSKVSSSQLTTSLSRSVILQGKGAKRTSSRGLSTTSHSITAEISRAGSSSQSSPAVTMSSRHKSTMPRGKGKFNPLKASKVNTALQLSGFSSPTKTGTNTLTKITHYEQNIVDKTNWLTAKLSLPFSSLTIAQAQDIHATFVPIRFACELSMWNRVMSMWSYMAGQSTNEDIRLRAHAIVCQLFDDLRQTQSIGTYATMKAANIDLPQHLLQFNLRANTAAYTLTMRAITSTQNYKGVLALYNEYQTTLDSIPNPDLLPPPLLAEGPEKEQEFIQRRLMAKRREELMPSPGFDRTTLHAALKLGDREMVDQLMTSFLTNRGYEPSTDVHKMILSNFTSTNQHIATIEYFRVVIAGKPRDGDIVNKVLSNPNTRVKTIENSSNQDGKPTYVLSSTNRQLDVNMPSFLEYDTSNVKRMTYDPSHEHWMALFRSLLALHPPADPNRGETTKSLLDTKELVNVIYKNNTSIIEATPSIRSHLYSLCADYGIPIDKRFFVPMIKEAPSANSIMSFMNDFHQLVEGYRLKHKENPWTEEELQQQADEREMNQMTVVDLNITPHDHTMRRLFGRYYNDVKQLGYDSTIYTHAQERLLSSLSSAFAKAEEDIATSRKPKDTTLFKRYSADSDIDDLSNPTTAADENGDGSQPLDQHSDKSSKSEAITGVAIYKSPVIDTFERLTKETSDLLLTSTRSRKARQVLEYITAVRTYQNAYGLPANPDSESAYLDSLILMSRRNEILPPLLSSKATSLIQPTVAMYTPLFEHSSLHQLQKFNQKYYDLKKKQMQASGLSPQSDSSEAATRSELQAFSNAIDYGEHITELRTFKDRVTYVRQHILRREIQLEIANKEVEMVINNLATMKNELDENLRLKQVHLRTLSNLIEAFAELGVDACALKGPFDRANIFNYDPQLARQTLFKMAKGQHIPGMQMDEKGRKYVPGITEPAAHQIDQSELTDLAQIAGRIGTNSFYAMKELTRLLTKYADGLKPSELQDIPLLARRDGTTQVVVPTLYLPMLRVLAAHGDFLQASLLIESAHQHRHIVPTTDMLNLLATAYINGGKPTHAVGVLDIMLSASKAENVIKQQVTEQDIALANKHGQLNRLIDGRTNQIEILPNSQTISILVRMFNEQGMLDHCEELWRRLVHRPETSWTQLSSVEEQQLIANALAAELDGVTDPGTLLDAQQRSQVDSVPDISLKHDDNYDESLNPYKNPDLRETNTFNELKSNSPHLLRSRPLPRVLPPGAYRELPPHIHLHLDSPATTAMIQAFIQMGHPMHALQLYIDNRQRMPTNPVQAPAPSIAFQRAIENARMMDTHQEDALTSVMADQCIPVALPTKRYFNALQSNNETLARGGEHNKTQSKELAIIPAGRVNMARLGDASKPEWINMAALSPRQVAANKSLSTAKVMQPVRRNKQGYNHLIESDENADTSHGQWLEADALASISLYCFKKAQKYHDLQEQGRASHLPEEVLQQASILSELSERTLSLLKRYAIDHPYLPGDPSALLYYHHPGTRNNYADDSAGLLMTSPGLVVPYLDSTEGLYSMFDTMVLSDIILEESLFKLRHSTVKPFGLKRWFTIYPTMINQLKALENLTLERKHIHNELEGLRHSIDAISSNYLPTNPDSPRNAAGRTLESITNPLHDTRYHYNPLDPEQSYTTSSRQVVNSTTPTTSRLVQSQYIQLTAPQHIKQRFEEHEEHITPETLEATTSALLSSKAAETRKRATSPAVDSLQDHAKWLHTFSNFLQSKDILSQIAPAEGDDDAPDSPAGQGSRKPHLSSSSSSKKMNQSMEDDDIDNDDDESSLPSILLPPEISHVKRHVANQAHVQRQQLAQRQDRNSYITDNADDDNDDINGSFTSEIFKRDNKANMQLQTAYHQHGSDTKTVTAPGTAMTSADWLIPSSDMALLRRTSRGLMDYESRVEKLPGIVENKALTTEHAIIMSRATNINHTTPKALHEMRPGGIHSSPHGPMGNVQAQSQFITPSSHKAFKQRQLDKIKDAVASGEALEDVLSREEFTNPTHSIMGRPLEEPFTVEKHGMSLSPRPQRATKIHHEFLEKHLFGITPLGAEERYQDASFILPGKDYKDDDVSQLKSQETHLSGPMLFRARTDKKQQDLAFEQRDILVDEFNNTVSPKTDALDRTQATHDARNPFDDLFDDAADDIAFKQHHSVQAMTGQSTGKNDHVINRVSDSRFHDLENTLDSLFNLRDDNSPLSSSSSTSAQRGSSANQQKTGVEAEMQRLDALEQELASEREKYKGKRIPRQVRDNQEITMRNIQRAKDVFSSALQHSAKDYFGVGHGSSKKGRSTLFD